MVVIYKKNSPYFTTPQRNFLVEFLDILTFRSIPADDTDELIVLSPQFNERPDLLSNELYGTPDLWWVFTVRNPDTIIDPIYDFVTEIEIFVPTRQRIFSLLGL
ncbi:hypothetical protein LCGC14_0554350 [marine sediment metagenome]|uniref:Uncharacterized protein n=1 Tax=marine sediment metagenome TaxID=412755 RepID=A0A0F9RNT5_9ZZZZ